MLDNGRGFERTSLNHAGRVSLLTSTPAQSPFRDAERRIGGTLSVETIANTVVDERRGILEALLHYELFGVAERVRWRMEDIPWASLDRSKLSENLPGLVRQIALAELTTYAATRRFLQEFSADIDFTQWMSVWFYEETKHPHVLIRWLHDLGETLSSTEVVRGRITAPFMKSRFGMLVTNVISEVHASATYVALARTTEEPVLKQIARNLAGDEARHATGFFVYARRALERSSKPDEDRLEALKVLHMWLNENGQVQHPVNTVRLRTSGNDELVGGLSAADGLADRHAALQQRLARRRALRLVASLTGFELNGAEQVVERIRTLTRFGSTSAVMSRRDGSMAAAQPEKET